MEKSNASHKMIQKINQFADDPVLIIATEDGILTEVKTTDYFK